MRKTDWEEIFKPKNVDNNWELFRNAFYMPQNTQFGNQKRRLLWLKNKTSWLKEEAEGGEPLTKTIWKIEKMAKLIAKSTNQQLQNADN